MTILISAMCETLGGFYDLLFDCIDRHAEVSLMIQLVIKSITSDFFLFLQSYSEQPLLCFVFENERKSITHNGILQCNIHTEQSRLQNYNIEDEPVCLLDTMRQDYVQGQLTYSDVFHTVWAALIAAGDTTSVSVR